MTDFQSEVTTTANTATNKNSTHRAAAVYPRQKGLIMAKVRLITDHFYRFNDRGEEHIGQYTGDDNEFECCVCGKGHKAKCFNVWHYIGNMDGMYDYETWGYGASHMPTIMEDLGTDFYVDIDK